MPQSRLVRFGSFIWFRKLDIRLNTSRVIFKQKSKSPLTTLLRVSAEASSDVVNILWI